ncbi:hypothetical protein [Burkholderia cenocepacia]|uniref:hypothetical protein n=1 Tax=Burkholderia cenocepacia TaxID=95486 RepID=UPI000761F9E6|nr:hypothetical protein [Burkholderia cenocepacia]KWU19052.1 hypothetical protein AS149_12455 [Burkholderia cenocepacia]
MKRTLRIASIVGFATIATLSGCASLSGSGTSQEVSVRTLKSGVPAEGVKCTLTNEKASYTVTTPANVVVHRAEGPMTVSCERPGAQPAVTRVNASKIQTSAGHDIANGLLGAAIDRKTGAAYEYPATVSVELTDPLPVHHQATAIQ